MSNKQAVIEIIDKLMENNKRSEDACWVLTLASREILALPEPSRYQICSEVIDEWVDTVRESWKSLEEWLEEKQRTQ